VSATVRQPPFDPDTQLPLVTDLAADPKLVFLAAELAEYLHWFPHLAHPLRLATAQANKKRRRSRPRTSPRRKRPTRRRRTTSCTRSRSPSGAATVVSRSLDKLGGLDRRQQRTAQVAWNITWLPALTATRSERAKLNRRGVAMPQLRKSLDVS
jgi:hypothetical protein